MILAAVAITLFLVVKGMQAFVKDGVPITEFFSKNWAPTIAPPTFGTLIFIFGSFSVTFLAALIAAPIGIGSALFMTEISKKYGRKILQPVLEILVGIPSVVYGFIGLVVLVPFFRIHLHVPTGFGLLPAAIVVAVMILPTVTSISADALQAVPESMRDAAAALGATRWQTIWRVIIPAALPSLLTAIIFGMARAFGEALAIQMVVGNSAHFPKNLLDPTGTLTTQITLSMGETPSGSVFNHVLWSMGLVLLVMSYIFIILIRVLSARRKY
ncbi:phosphate ABC transporter permease subunit PstC [Pullulanibacillus sp. KACC 23026]|nr:phosphate ABC transporter permease subunit PstC [Pullulanibacillus sp. KACC 23026]WEG14923.1 phosphate ABC transporter permease subunit PstC [Pullulanibacillus sp. KACC 23026]